MMRQVELVAIVNMLHEKYGMSLENVNRADLELDIALASSNAIVQEKRTQEERDDEKRTLLALNNINTGGEGSCDSLN